MLINRRIKQFYALCLLLLLLGLAVAYRNGSFLHPKYDFLYWTTDGGCVAEFFSVSHGRIVENEFDCVLGKGNIRLYRYDVKHNQSREISTEEAMTYQVADPRTSPDGYGVRYGRSYTPMSIFWYLLGGDDKMYMHNLNDIYLVKGFAKRLLDIRQGPNPSWGDFIFLTWVISSEQK